MAFASKKAARLILAAALSATAALPAEIRFDARYKGRPGAVTVDAQGIAWQDAKHRWRWSYPDIQQLRLGAHSLRVTSGRTYEFIGEVPAGIYPHWKDRLDQRFVAALADPAVHAGWRIPVRHVTRRTPTEGTIEIGADRIVYAADRPDDSRTWRYSDIDNISTSGPFQLTITTLEKSFNFELKQVLSEVQFNELWLQINLGNRRIQLP